MDDTLPKTVNKGEDADTLAVGPGDSKLRLEAARPEMSLLHFSFFGIGLFVGLLLSLLDTTIVATSLFEIGTDLEGLGHANWVALAYTLTYLSFAVFIARISDIIGRRNTFTASYLVFIAASIACGCVHDVYQLIACRAIQGLGGSGLYSLTMIILPEVSPPKMRRYIGGMIGFVVALSTILGPILGGVLTHYCTWRWIFWINGPVGTVSMLLFYVLWPRTHGNRGRRSWKNLDYIGSILLIVGSVLVVFPFQNAGDTLNRWSNVIFVAPLIIGVASWLGLFLWSIFVERRREDIDAALPMRLMRDRVYTGAVLNTMCLGFPNMLLIYAFPLRVQVINEKDALIAGVMLLSMLGPSALCSLIIGVLNSKKDRTFGTLLVGGCSMVLGCGLLSTLSSAYEVEGKILGFLVFVGVGFGLSVSTATMVAAKHSSPKDHASAQGIIAQVRVLGGSIGIAASTDILRVTLQKQLGIVETEYFAMVRGPMAVLTEKEVMAIRQAYSDAFNESMRVCSCIAGVAVLSVFAMSRSSQKQTNVDV
ncbi:major facilitator superfamily transporter [Hypoxylon sp. FL1150]|nr:major facilitator superfamily transporter [Hypoxylon sp. FL1150]